MRVEGAYLVCALVPHARAMFSLIVLVFENLISGTDKGWQRLFGILGRVATTICEQPDTDGLVLPYLG